MVKLLGKLTNERVSRMIESLEYVKKNELIAKDTYQMDIYSENIPKMKPGMFVNLRVDGFILRRPLSIC